MCQAEHQKQAVTASFLLSLRSDHEDSFTPLRPVAVIALLFVRFCILFVCCNSFFYCLFIFVCCFIVPVVLFLVICGFVCSLIVLPLPSNENPFAVRNK